MENLSVSDPPITREQLPNGLMVMLKEIHTAPIISHWLWYRVGSRNEIPGRTGDLALGGAHVVQGHPPIPGVGAG